MNTSLQQEMEKQVQKALQEDIGDGNISAALIDAGQRAAATIVCREQAVLCGTAWVDCCFRQFDHTVELQWLVHEGQMVTPDTDLCRLRGSARSLLTVERTALNFLQTLSATASAANEYVKRLEHCPIRLLDTRKTLPGWRLAQKYATTVGGADNHRMGLFDAYLIKENHIAACGGIINAVSQARKLQPDRPVQVEVENLAELAQALEARADSILLDNFTLADMRRAVAANNSRARLEASGGVTLDTIAAIAETGVDAVSVGAITKHIQAVDLSMRFTTE